MLNHLITRLRQGHRTIGYPAAEPVLPERFQGRPLLDSTLCRGDCMACREACPTEAIALGATRSSGSAEKSRAAGAGPEAAGGEARGSRKKRARSAGATRSGPTSQSGIQLDLGRCVFCSACAAICPTEAIRFSRDHRLAVPRREELLLTSGQARTSAEALQPHLRRLFGRSLQLRQVSAGGCNACEADLNVLSTIGFDLGRFGLGFVASPRHADGIVVTGPVTENMREALAQTYAAVPAPRLVIAVGACAISGGLFRGHPETHDGASSALAIDLFVPGCPPHPLTILEGLLRLLGRIPDRSR